MKTQDKGFVMSFDEEDCQIDGLKGKLRTVKVKEKMPDGKLKVVYSDIHFMSDDTTPGYRDLLKLFKWPEKTEEGRAA